MNCISKLFKAVIMAYDAIRCAISSWVLYGAVALTTLVTGCAASGPGFQILEQALPGQAIIYIYRDQRVPRSMSHSPVIEVNGVDHGYLSLDGYMKVVVPSGTVTVATKHAYRWPKGAPTNSVSMKTESGKRYFMSFAVTDYEHAGNTMYLGARLFATDEQTAMRHLPKLKLSQ